MRHDLPLALAFALLAGCIADPQGTDIGNAATFEMRVAAEGEVLGGRDVGSVNQAWMALHELEFSDCSGDEREVAYEGDFEVDLIEGPSLGEAVVPFDVLCELEFESKPAPGSPEPLGDSSVVITGLSNGGVPFEVRSEAEFEFEIEEELALQEAISRLALLFDAQEWFRGIDPDLGEATDGVILIDEQHNPGLLFDFEDNLNRSARLTPDD